MSDVVKPYGQRVVVTDPPAEQRHDSGLIIPAEYERIHRGIVVSVGDDVPHLEPGDVVYYGECGIEIGTFKVVPAKCIIAYDKEDV